MSTISFHRTIFCLLFSSITIFGAVFGACHVSGDEPAHVRGKSKLQGIVGGEETGYLTWQGAVGLHIQEASYSYSICTGTLIDPKVVITAGHCVYYPSNGIDVLQTAEDITVFGGPYMNIPLSLAAKVVKHPQWNGDINDLTGVDLAMIKLVTAVKDVETYTVTNQELVAGTKGKIVGYGLASNEDLTSSEVHRVGDAEILRLSKKRLFELGNPAGTCQGDSGGPFFMRQNDRWVLAGVTTFGTSKVCDPMTGSWDVNVSTHRPWINSILLKFTGRGLASPDDTDTHGRTEIDSDEWDTDPNYDIIFYLPDGGYFEKPFGMSQPNPVACRFEPARRRSSGRLIALLSLLF